MNINYNDVEEKLEFYCNKCNGGLMLPLIQTNAKYCSYCGHKFDVNKVNKIRQKIKRICVEEGH